MLPRRFERSTVQNWRMMSLAGSEMAGSFGKWTGLDTILGWLAEVGGKKGVRQTVYISQWGFGSRKEGILLETHISRYLAPTNRQLSYGPWIG
jgi:hypothetical protein